MTTSSLRFTLSQPTHRSLNRCPGHLRTSSLTGRPTETLPNSSLIYRRSVRGVAVPCRALFGGLFGGGKGKKEGGGKGTCRVCKGTGTVQCKGCKGSGRNRANGNMLERWKCYDCQGFGLVKCPKCGKAGLTPEQRGER